MPPVACKSLILLGTALATATAVLAGAKQAFAAGPTSYLEDSAIVGTGSTISISRVPVITSGGDTIYLNVTVVFTVNPDGSLSYATSAPSQMSSPNVLVSNIATGAYLDTSTDNNGFTIAGPGVPHGGGYSTYTVSQTSGETCAYATPSVFYTGPVNNTPLAARIKKAKIPTSQYTFGEVGTSCVSANSWPSNGIVGFAQSGGILTVTSFSYFNTNDNSVVDTSSPVASVNYSPVNP